jgi:hypothetical protein
MDTCFTYYRLFHFRNQLSPFRRFLKIFFVTISVTTNVTIFPLLLGDGQYKL